MAGSTFGDVFRVMTWGESHGEGVGAVVDGCPAGLGLTEEMIQKYMDRRKPGAIKYSTPRKEDDRVRILSGVFDGRTTGTPISMAIYNTNQISKDYSDIMSCFRPGHADFTFENKYGFRDYRGGGRSSGRETAGRVAAGAVASLFLKELGIQLTAYTKSIGNIVIDPARCDYKNIGRSPLYMPDPAASKEAEAYLSELMSRKDSAGGVVECVVNGLPVGIGDPVFDKLDAGIAKAIMSIGAVKGVEIGDGFAAALSRGTINNDAFITKDGRVSKETNHSGGVLGGMSDGSSLVFRAAFKPTPSVASMQHTVTKTGEAVNIEIKGRHDPVIVPRAVVVVEAMAAITIADLILKGMTATVKGVKDFYGDRK